MSAVVGAMAAVDSPMPSARAAEGAHAGAAAEYGYPDGIVPDFVQLGSLPDGETGVVLESVQPVPTRKGGQEHVLVKYWFRGDDGLVADFAYVRVPARRDGDRLVATAMGGGGVLAAAAGTQWFVVANQGAGVWNSEGFVSGAEYDDSTGTFSIPAWIADDGYTVTFCYEMPWGHPLHALVGLTRLGGQAEQVSAQVAAGVGISTTVDGMTPSEETQAASYDPSYEGSAVARLLGVGAAYAEPSLDEWKAWLSDTDGLPMNMLSHGSPRCITVADYTLDPSTLSYSDECAGILSGTYGMSVGDTLSFSFYSGASDGPDKRADITGVFDYTTVPTPVTGLHNTDGVDVWCAVPQYLDRNGAQQSGWNHAFGYTESETQLLELNSNSGFGCFVVNVGGDCFDQRITALCEASGYGYPGMTCNESWILTGGCYDGSVVWPRELVGDTWYAGHHYTWLGKTMYCYCNQKSTIYEGGMPEGFSDYGSYCRLAQAMSDTSGNMWAVFSFFCKTFNLMTGSYDNCQDVSGVFAVPVPPDIVVKTELKVHKVGGDGGGYSSSELLSLQAYSLAGAEYTVYSDAACRTQVTQMPVKDSEDKVDVLVTDEHGDTVTVLLDGDATYWVRETKESPGHRKDGRTWKVADGAVSEVQAQR